MLTKGVQIMEWKCRVISKPTYEECDQLLRIIQGAFGTKEESIYFLKTIADYGRLFVTFSQTEPICIIQAIKSWDDVNNVQLVSCAVSPDHQGKGVATFTHVEMLKKLKLEGVKSIGVSVPPDHAAVIKILQEKLEFVPIREIANYYGLGEDRLYLEKEL